MHRILLSLATVVLLGGLVVGGTGAFFSDEETSTGNVFAAGAIDLKIDNSSYGFDWNRPGSENPTGQWGPNENNSWTLNDLTNQLFFDFHDLKPGDYGEDTISLHVNDNDAYACMAFDLTATPENGQNEPEAKVDNTAGPDEGELQKYLDFVFWYDDGDNVLETDEEGGIIDALSGLPGSIFSGNWLPIAESTDDPLPGGETLYIGKGWCFGELAVTPAPEADNPTGPTPGNTGFTCNGAGDHNDAQTDGINVDVSFYAVQSRNNGAFLCSQLPPLREPTVEPGHIIVEKITTNQDTATNFSFTATWGGFSLVGGGSEDSGPLTPGAFSVSETVPEGWSLDSATCAGDDDGTNPATITLDPGEVVTCTFTNSPLPAEL